MARFLHPTTVFTFRKYPRGYLAFSWLLGLGVGGLIFRSSGDFVTSLMPLAAAGQLSIVSLILRTSLPFLLSAFAVYLGKSRLLLLIGFCRAFLFGYVLCAVFAAFGDKSWLIRWLLLFSSTFSCALFFGYSRRYISGLRRFSLGELAFCEVLLGLLVCLDYFYVSPFLRRLLS